MSTFDAGNAKATFILDDQQFQTAAAGITATLNNLAGSFQGNYFGLSQLSRGFTEAGAAMSAGLLLSVNAAVSWEQEMSRLRALGTDFNASAAQNKQALDGVVTGLQQLAEVTPVPIAELGAIATKLAQVGTSQGDIVSLTRAVANFSLVTGASAETVITNFTRIQSVVGIAQQQLPQFLNAMFVAFKNTGVSVDQLFQNLNILGPVIAELQSSMHVSGAEAIFLAAAMGNIPGQARQIRTAFVNLGADISTALQKSGSSLKELTDLLGVSEQQLRQAFGADPTRLVIQLTEALDKAAPTTQQLNNLLQGLGDKGKLVLPSIEAVVRSTAHLGAQQQDAIAILDQLVQAYTRTNELQKATDQVTDTTAAHMLEFKNTLTVLEQTVGTGLLPALSTLVTFFTNVVSGFTSLGPVVDTIVVGLVGFAGITLLIGGRLIAMIAQVVLARQAILAMKQAQDQKTATDIEESAASDKATGSTERQTVAVTQLGRAAAAAKTQIASLNATQEAGGAVAPGAGGAAAVGAAGTGAAVGAQQELAAAEGEVVAMTREELAAFLELSGSFATVDEETSVGVEAFIGLNTEMGITLTELEALIPILEGFAVAEEEAAASAGILGAALDFALGPIGLAIAAIGVVIGGLALLGAANRSATQDTLSLKQAEDSLKAAISSANGDITNSVRASLDATLTTGRFATALKDVHLEASTVESALLGDAAAGAIVAKALNSGGSSAKFLSDALVGLHDEILKDVAALSAKTQAQDADANASQASQHAAQAQADATAAQAEKANAANSAMVDYVHQLSAVRDASFGVTDAQQKLKDAEQSVADEAQDAAKAQVDIESAQVSEQRAAETLTDALRNQAEAGVKAQEELAAAQQSLDDAQSRYSDSLTNIQTKQKALNDALTEGAKVADEVQKAENQIADARLREQESALAVEDAEFKINFLRGEGASQRDIEQAELGLQKARNDSANATQSEADATQNLAALATKQADDIAKAQKDLTAAYRERQKAVLDIATATQHLQDVQADVSSGKAERDAALAVEEAQIGVARASDQVITSQRELQKVYDGSREEAVARANNDLIKSYVALADARSKMQIDELKARGITVTSADEARIFAGNLHDVAGGAGAARGEIEGMANSIRAFPVPKPVGADLAAGMDGSTAKIKKGIDDITKAITGGGSDWIEKTRASTLAMEALHLRSSLQIKGAWALSNRAISEGASQTGQQMVSSWVGKLEDLERTHKVSATAIVAVEEDGLDKMLKAHDTAGAQILITHSAHSEALIAYMEHRWPRTLEIINQLTGGWKTSIDDAGVHLVTSVGKMSEDLASNFENKAHKPSKAEMEQMSSEIQATVVELGNQIHDKGLQATLQMARAIDQAHPELNGAMERAVQDMGHGANAEQEGRQVGNDFLGGFLKHIEEHGQDFISQVGGLFSGLVDHVGSVLGIGSPSKVTMQMGEYVTQGFMLGLLNNQEGVRNAARLLAQAATGDLSNTASALNFGVTGVGGIGTGVGGSVSASDQLTSEVKDLVAAIKAWQVNNDTFHLTSVNGASAGDMADEIMWRKWVRT